MMTSTLADRERAFTAIAAEAARLAKVPLISLFDADPRRANAFTFTAPHLRLDLSKQRLDAGALDALLALARAANFDGARRALFAGDLVNVTENRAALHTALRAPSGPAEVQETQARMRAFARELAGVDAVVHLGIGGSDLGPRLVYEALKQHRRRDIALRFAANIDGADIADALDGLDPARTLIVVVSKTFTTLETISNANVARAWLGSNPNDRLAAVTAAPDKAAAWGAPASRIFPFWDWVGGRYSIWSAVSLSLELSLQAGTIDRFRAGAADMDAHFRDAPMAENIPLLAAAAQTWNREALGRGSYAMIPYAHRLRLLPSYLQQLEMESNGKRVDRDGRPLARASAGVTWGEPGTVAQHSFFQLLHQGVEEIPVEFLLAERGGEGPGAHRTALLANALGQARALMVGKSTAEAEAEMRASGTDPAEAARLAPHRTFPGDRASTLIGVDALTPEALGALIAFYEHRTFSQGVLAGINSFDQYGVELGKATASALTPALEGKPAAADLDGSTRAWIERLKS